MRWRLPIPTPIPAATICWDMRSPPCLAMTWAISCPTTAARAASFRVICLRPVSGTVEQEEEKMAAPEAIARKLGRIRRFMVSLYRVVLPRKVVHVGLVVQFESCGLSDLFPKVIG